MTKWLQQYILLALRIGKVIKERTGEILYDYYGEKQLEADSTDLTALQRATDMLRGAWCNAAFLLDEGRQASEAVKYIVKHTLYNEEQANYAVRSLQRPFCESYIFTYYYGRKLLEPVLCVQQRKEKLRYLLTEQVTLSDLK